MMLASGVFPLTRRGCRYAFSHGHKISSLHLDGAAASCPSYDFDGAKTRRFPESYKKSPKILREFKDLFLIQYCFEFGVYKICEVVGCPDESLLTCTPEEVTGCYATTIT